jgi:hypothetical protein
VWLVSRAAVERSVLVLQCSLEVVVCRRKRIFTGRAKAGDYMKAGEQWNRLLSDQSS